MKVLFSFHYYRDTDLDELVAAFPTPPQVFADSGAFSAMSVGADVQLHEYVAWLQRWHHLFTTYVNLDVIGDAEATWTNQQAMEDAGLQPVPVFHGGSPWDHLERYCQRYPYVALGGMVFTAGPRALLRWCVEAFQRARPHGTVFHGFAQTKLSILKALPWYSVDSSSWSAGHRYGTLSLWDDQRATWVRCTLGNHADVYSKAPLIRAHGGDPAVLAKRGVGLNSGKESDQYLMERAMVIGVNVVAWVRCERYLQRRHGPVVHPNLPTPGPSVYLAEARPAGNDLMLAERAAGPMVYLVDGHPEHLVTAAKRLERPW